MHHNIIDFILSADCLILIVVLTSVHYSEFCVLVRLLSIPVCRRFFITLAAIAEYTFFQPRSIHSIHTQTPCTIFCSHIYRYYFGYPPAASHHTFNPHHRYFSITGAAVCDAYIFI